MHWRDRIITTLQPAAQAAAAAVDAHVLRVDFDWQNGVFRVLIPEVGDGDDDAVEAAVLDATGVDTSFDSPTFSYSKHLRAVTGLVEHAAVSAGPLPVTLQLGELVGFRRGLETLAQVAANFPRCATFALGGLPLMGFVARLPRVPNLDPSTDAGLEAYEAAITASQNKFHVHEGLLWEVTNPTPTERFQRWLATLPDDEPLLIIDTTFSGGGIDRIVNVLLATPARPHTIEIHGLLDRSRTLHAPPTRSERDSRGVITATLHPVPRLITEDAAAMVGFESMRSIGGLQARWDAATVEVRDGEDVLTVIGTSNLAHTVSELVDRMEAGGSMDGDFIAASTYMAMLMQLDTERRRVLGELERARSNGLIDDREWELDHTSVTKRFEGLKRVAVRKYEGTGAR